MKTVCVVQARLGSTRFPRKVIADIDGKPMVQHVLDRAAAIPGVDQIVLAMPDDDFREIAVRCAITNRIALFSGPAEDVLCRYWLAVQEYQADIIVRVTADCPLLAPDVCARVLEPVASGRFQYATNDTCISGFPDGLDCQVFTRDILNDAHNYCDRPDWREHVCPWMEANTQIVEQRLICEENRRRNIAWPKLSVDTPEDLERVRRIMARIPAGDYSWKATKEAINKERDEYNDFLSVER